MIHALILAACPAIAAQDAAVEPPPRFEVPAGAVSDRIALLGTAQVPAVLPRAQEAVDWLAPATFERWRASLAIASAPGKSATDAEDLAARAEDFAARARDLALRAQARADLALLALAQDRAADAWEHFTNASVDPAVAAALLPRFLPGIPVGMDLGAGGLAGPLPDGVELAPATPPNTRAIERGRIERRSMRVRGLRVGDAVLGLRIAVEPEGVQIDVEHISGGAARVAVKLPTEPGFGFANEYVDWFQAEKRGVAHVLEIRPGDEEHTLYGRFEPREEVPRIALPDAAPAVVELGGIAIRPEPGAEGRARAEALVRALTGAPLGLNARVLDTGANGVAAGWTPILVDLTDPRTSAAKVAALCGAVERFSLR